MSGLLAFALGKRPSVECEENIFVGGQNLDMSRVLAFALRKRPSVKCDEIILFGGQN
jgi:hypothetical protein